jgi:hypothetical protein
MATETQHLESIGHICATLQKPYGAIRRALADVGAEPAMVLNGVAHYAEADVERAAERLQQCKCETHGVAVGGTPNNGGTDSRRAVLFAPIRRESETPG